MSNDLDPMVDAWYQHLDKGDKFEVVAIDDANGLVEIQYFDGNMDELDIDAWRHLKIELIEPPEDWTGPIDDIETDDLGYTETDMQPEDWGLSQEETPPQEATHEEEETKELNNRRDSGRT